MNKNIFRQYDIRGVADSDLEPSLVRDLGKAIGTFHRRKDRGTIAVGRDCRLSSPRLHGSLISGIQATGLNVVDLGIVPTPLLYFAVFHYELDGGVQITGSHNPSPDNGFKMMSGRASLFGDDILELRKMIETSDFDLPGGGVVRERNVLPAYVGFMKGNISLQRTDLRFAIDAGNGAGGPTALATFRALGLDPIGLLCDMDGRFPAHHPDPTDPANLELLRDTISHRELDFGIAYDGDADRIGVVDSKGSIVWGDKLMILLSRALLRDHPNAAILGEVKCSQTLYDEISKHGGRPILWKTGHSLIKTKMKEENALLAGEMSGHIFYADRYFGFDDAIYVSLRLLEILSKSEKSLHELLEDVPATATTPEIRIPCGDDEKFKIVEALTSHFRKSHQVVDIDGARILFDQGWGLVRASNTQPALVMRFEAADEARLDDIQTEVQGVLESLSGTA
ncbi:MAG: phosphomannomutase/phosphoglucomutase [Myxococcota bacterium]